jgi:hypothetical protein
MTATSTKTFKFTQLSQAAGAAPRSNPSARQARLSTRRSNRSAERLRAPSDPRMPAAGPHQAKPGTPPARAKGDLDDPLTTKAANRSERRSPQSAERFIVVTAVRAGCPCCARIWPGQACDLPAFLLPGAAGVPRVKGGPQGTPGRPVDHGADDRGPPVVRSFISLSVLVPKMGAYD